MSPPLTRLTAVSPSQAGPKALRLSPNYTLSGTNVGSHMALGREGEKSSMFVNRNNSFSLLIVVIGRFSSHVSTGQRKSFCRLRAPDREM